jgi:hypothetical protein
MRLADLLPAFADPTKAAQAVPDDFIRGLAVLASVLIADADEARNASERRIERRAHDNYLRTQGIAQVFMSITKTERINAGGLS